MKIWTPKTPCLKNGYAQSVKDMVEHKNRFRFNPLAKVGSLFVPQPLRMSPGYPCCWEESDLCGLGASPECTTCTETPPTEMEISFYGTTNVNCNECETSLNGHTFILKLGGPYSGACRWYKVVRLCGSYGFFMHFVVSTYGISVGLLGENCWWYLAFTHAYYTTNCVFENLRMDYNPSWEFGVRQCYGGYALATSL